MSRPTELPLGRAALALLAMASAVSIATACGRPAQVAPRPSREGRFDHARHLPPAMAWPDAKGTSICLECHEQGKGELTRPGANDHAPCDRKQCHADAFVKAAGPVCEICHRDSTDGLPTADLQPYPPMTGYRSQASNFSHQSHLDFGAIERAVGFHVSCTDCHPRRPDGSLQSPTHSNCARCHAREAVRKGVVAMDQCARCHQERRVPPARKRRLIVGDLRFDHRNHRTDARGKLILCAECHVGTADVVRVGDHDVPPTRSCVSCHDDDDRVGDQMAMRVCETCHATRVAGIGAIPPRSHLPREERPANHTLAFREDHEREARRSPEECARCHSFMSGARRDTCDQCHQVMRPRSHTATWAEFEHGPAAAVQQDSCATCHGSDFCVACHSRPPRSHFPLPMFNTGHAVPASLNVRACLTCHDPSTGFCNGSGCHAPGPGGLPH